MNRMLLHLLLTTVVLTANLGLLANHRHALFKEAEKSNPENPALALSSKLAAALQLGADPKDDPWVDFALPAQTVQPDIQKRGDTLLDENALTQKASEIVEKHLPSLANNKADPNKDAHSLNHAYINKAPGAIKEFFGLATRFLVRQAHQKLRAARSVSGSKFSFEYPNTATQAFKNGLRARLSEYYDKYDHQRDIKTVTVGTTTTRTETTETLVKIYAELQVMLNGEDSAFQKNGFDAIFAASTFLYSLPVYLDNEAEYLVAAAWAADATARTGLLGRAERIIKHLGKLKAAGIYKYTDEEIANNWVASYSEEMQACESDKEKTAAGGQVYGVVAKALHDSLGASAALTLVVQCTEYRLNERLGLFSDRIPFKTLTGLPFADSAADVPTETAKAWYLISELPNNPESWVLDWFEKVQDKVDEVLGLSHNAVFVMNHARQIFTPSLLPASEADFYKALFQAVAEFAVASQGVTGASFAEKMSAHLDKTQGANKFYILMKLAVINSVPNYGFPVSFGAAGAGVVEETGKLLTQKTYEWYGQMVQKAFVGLAIKPVKANHDAQLLAVLENCKKSSNGQISSGLFAVVSWKRTAII